MCDYDIDVVWNGNTYYAFAFDFPEMSNVPGELPNFQLQISNTSKSAHSILEEYNGAGGGVCTLFWVSGTDIANSSPALSYQFTVMNAKANQDWATLTLGGANPMRRPFTKLIYTVDHCQWVYNSPVIRASLNPDGATCSYRGSAATCDKTLNGSNGCVAHGNEARFGATPGVGTQGFRFATVS